MATKKRPTRPTSPGPRELPDQLRDAISERGVTPYELGKSAMVDPGQISRFMDGERDVMLATAGRLCTALNLKLSERAGKVGRPASTKKARPLGDPAE